MRPRGANLHRSVSSRPLRRRSSRPRGSVLLPPPRTGSARAIVITPPSNLIRCPWVRRVAPTRREPRAARPTGATKMSLGRKSRTSWSFKRGTAIENYNGAIPSLCIPSLTLSDGPDGLAGRDSGQPNSPPPLGSGPRSILRWPRHSAAWREPRLDEKVSTSSRGQTEPGSGPRRRTRLRSLRRRPVFDERTRRG